VFVLIGLNKVLVLELARCEYILRRVGVNVTERQRVRTIFVQFRRG